MSTSRIPLSTSSISNRATPSTLLRTPSISRESALTRTTAAKIKRKSIGVPSAATAVKRARPLTTRPASPTGTTSNVSSRSNQLSAPLPSSFASGRMTVAGSNLVRPGFRAPVSAISRQRTGSTSLVEEKEALKQKLEETTMELNGTKEELKEKKVELAEEKKEKRELKEEHIELKEQLSATKLELREMKAEMKETKNDLQEEKRSHEQTKKENEEHLSRLKNDYNETIRRLKSEAIDKDDQMRQLHNDVVDLRGRIRVSVRVRPLLEKEKDESTDHLSYPDGTTVGIEQQKGKLVPFSFNHVYGPTYSQLRIFEGVKDLILSVLHGYNVCLISYGQTGSGKTYTMRGGEDDAAGLIPRAVKFLFENRRRLEDLDWSFEFAASFLEVYNDCCYDLLSTPPRAKREIKQIKHKFIVDGLTEEPITDAIMMTSLLRKSDANRSTAATKCNEESSRSHAIFALSVKGTNQTTGAKINCTLKLVDLAGSERAKESGVVGERFTEMTHINTALSNLQSCIRSILSKQSHVPYRNSKLTTLLQDSLEGGSKCMVILSLSPQLTALNETKRTLEFGKNLSHTHIGAAKKKET